MISDLGTLLTVWAHPDDEAYLAGGIMAMASDAGQRVVCVTATRGEAGITADEQRWPLEHLADVRTRELEDCLGILGVREHHWLDEPDGACAGADRSAAVERIAGIVDDVAPDTVLTFGPDGMTGHPDHCTVSGWVVDAVRLAGAAAPVLFAVKRRAWAEAFAALNDEVFPDGVVPTAPDGELALHVELAGEVLDRKVAALEAQASQTAAVLAAIGRERFAAWVAEETYRRAPEDVRSRPRS